MVINFSIPLTMHTFTLKSLCAACVLNSKDSIPVNAIPQTLMEDYTKHVQAKERRIGNRRQVRGC